MADKNGLEKTRKKVREMCRGIGNNLEKTAGEILAVCLDLEIYPHEIPTILHLCLQEELGIQASYPDEYTDAIPEILQLMKEAFPDNRERLSAYHLHMDDCSRNLVRLVKIAATVPIDSVVLEGEGTIDDIMNDDSIPPVIRAIIKEAYDTMMKGDSP